MNTQKSPITIKARWDHHQVPVGENASRGLLLEIEAEKLNEIGKKERPPVWVSAVTTRCCR